MNSFSAAPLKVSLTVSPIFPVAFFNCSAVSFSFSAAALGTALSCWIFYIENVNNNQAKKKEKSRGEEKKEKKTKFPLVTKS